MRRNLVLLTAFCALTSFAAHADDQRRENLYTVTALTSNLPNVGRVEDWRASRPRHPDRATFPAPSTSHAACGFPALRAPICFTSGLMGPIRPGQLSVRRVALDSC